MAKKLPSITSSEKKHAAALADAPSCTVYMISTQPSSVKTWKTEMSARGKLSKFMRPQLSSGTRVACAANSALSSGRPMPAKLASALPSRRNTSSRDP